VDWSRSQIVECFERGEAPLDARLMAARGGLDLSVAEQLSLLMTLASDPAPEVAAAARRTISRLPAAALADLLAQPDVPPSVRAFYLSRPAPPPGLAPEDDVAASAPPEGGDGEPREVDSGSADGAADPGVPADGEAPAGQPPERMGTLQRLTTMNVAARVKVAMQGSREERSILIRDPNRIVAAAVLSSPKLTESDVEDIARMSNVSEEVPFLVGTHRTWTRNYTVVSALARNPKTPVGVSLSLLSRLAERDLKILATDRNVPEPVRLSARKLAARSASRRQ
jgi:hypothetical protein